MLLRHDILSILGVIETQNHDKYLRLPSTMGRSKSELVFANLKERLWSKIMGCKENLLSRASKEAFIKRVAQAIPIYTMGYLCLLEYIINASTLMVKKFWGSEGIHCVKWEMMCRPKSMGVLVLKI